MKRVFGFVETARVEPRPNMETPYDQALIGVGSQNGHGCPDRCLDTLVSLAVALVTQRASCNRQQSK